MYISSLKCHSVAMKRFRNGIVMYCFIKKRQNVKMHSAYRLKLVLYTLSTEFMSSLLVYKYLKFVFSSFLLLFAIADDAAQLLRGVLCFLR